MLLPKYLSKNQSGQVLVIFLLVLVIGLALVLSIASRTVTDIRQTTTSDESNRAYFAAESGVEDALKKIESNLSPGSYSLNFEAVNRTDANVVVSDILWTTSETQPLDFGSFKKDDVAQVNLLNVFNNLGAGSNILPNNTLNLYWGDTNEVYSGATVPAIEVSIVTHNAGTWGIKKMTFDPAGRNNFCSAAVGGAPGTKYRYLVALRLNSNASCSRNDTVTDSPVIARVRFLYNDEVIFGVSADINLTKQGDRIISTGQTDSGVTRKIQVNRFYPALPAIFDYVLYNGSTNPLCKGSAC